MDFQRSLLEEAVGQGAYTIQNTGSITLSGGEAVGTAGHYLFTTDTALMTILSAQVGTTNGYYLGVKFSGASTLGNDQVLISMTLGTSNAKIEVALQASTNKIIVTYTNTSGTVVLQLTSATASLTAGHVVFNIGVGGNELYIGGSAESPTYLTGTSATNLVLSDFNAVSLFDTYWTGGTALGNVFTGNIDLAFIGAEKLTSGEVTTLFGLGATDNYTFTAANNNLTVADKLTTSALTFTDGNEALDAVLVSNALGVANWSPVKNYIIRSAQSQTSETGFDAVDGTITFRGYDLMVHVIFSGYSPTSNTARSYNLQYSTNGGSSWTTLVSRTFYFNPANTRFPMDINKIANIPDGTVVNKWRINNGMVSDGNDPLTVTIQELFN
jgi:hypothetical protein